MQNSGRMTVDNTMVDTVDTFYQIAPERFHYLKFILEGYDNLAVLSSVSNKHGIIRLKCSGNSLPELINLLTDIAPSIKRSSL